ncbi:MAG: shikimate kinase [Candidatus Howiella sp.]|jgi:shikimate kinase
MNIVLCGFMGCGKTTVGRMTARRLGIDFVDMDVYIEQQAGMTVSEIFASKGESAFRRMETEAARQLSERNNLMIATGGGTVLNPENVALLKRNGVIVLLQVSPETVLWRLRNNNTRPLLQRPDKEAAVRTLMAERTPVYKNAAGIILSANMPSGQVAAQLSHLAKKYIDKQVGLVL